MPYQEDQAASLQHAEPLPEPKTTEIPATKENPVPMAQSPSEVPMTEAPSEVLPTAVPTAEQPLRRSSRITSRPKFLSDYVLY